jgi:hypothetical protein
MNYLAPITIFIGKMLSKYQSTSCATANEILQPVGRCKFYMQDLYNDYAKCDRCPFPVQQRTQYLNCVWHCQNN